MPFTIFLKDGGRIPDIVRPDSTVIFNFFWIVIASNMNIKRLLKTISGINASQVNLAMITIQNT